MTSLGRTSFRMGWAPLNHKSPCMFRHANFNRFLELHQEHHFKFHLNLVVNRNTHTQKSYNSTIKIKRSRGSWAPLNPKASKFSEAAKFLPENLQGPATLDSGTAAISARPFDAFFRALSASQHKAEVQNQPFTEPKDWWRNVRIKRKCFNLSGYSFAVNHLWRFKTKNNRYHIEMKKSYSRNLVNLSK